MIEMYITEEDLEYYSNPIPISTVNEATTTSYKSKISFEEAVKACNGITIEEFGKMWHDAINNDPRFA